LEECALAGERCGDAETSFSLDDVIQVDTSTDVQGDIGAGKMIFGVEGVDPQRREKLIDLLDIDLAWRLNKVSDGQRRRVQICMGLLKPYQVPPPLPFDGMIYTEKVLRSI